MKILMIHPSQGGIDLYVKTLAQELQFLGVDVDLKHTPKSAWPYNPKTKSWNTSKYVQNKVINFAKSIDFSKYDIVAFHFGSIDPEQYLPLAFYMSRIKVPNPVYFVHILKHSLFGDRLNDKKTQLLVNKAHQSFFSNYFFFSKYALKYFKKLNIPINNYAVGFLPETHFPPISNYNISKEIKDSIKSRSSNFIISWVGYASDYKAVNVLVESLPYIKQANGYNYITFLLCGRGWLKKVGEGHISTNNAELIVIDKELNPSEFGYVIKKSNAGILLYYEPKNFIFRFQGSGTLPNYIWQRKPLIISDLPPLREYAGIEALYVEIKNSISSKEVADRVNLLIKTRDVLISKVSTRRHFFDRKLHAKQCLSFFKQILSNTKQ